MLTIADITHRYHIEIETTPEQAWMTPQWEFHSALPDEDDAIWVANDLARCHRHVRVIDTKETA